jgi:hypothetical protein
MASDSASPKREPQQRLPTEPPPGFGIPEKIGSIPGDREHHEAAIGKPESALRQRRAARLLRRLLHPQQR